MSISLNNLSSQILSLQSSISTSSGSSSSTSNNIVNLSDVSNQFWSTTQDNYSIILATPTTTSTAITNKTVMESILSSNLSISQFNTNYILDNKYQFIFKNIVNVVASDWHTVFLESSGKVLACGKNDGTNGWTGHITTNGATYIPQYVLGTSGVGSQLQNITNITCSTYHTVFLESSGKVLACGNNNGIVGWTGHRTNAGATYYPQYVLGTSGSGSQLQNITNIACSDWHTVFLESSGNVIACGYNGTSDGITGHRTNSGATLIPQYVLGTSGTSSLLQNITKINCNPSLTIFLENSGKVLACGRNDGTSGWTGHSTTTGLTYIPQYVLGTSGAGSQLQNITNITTSYSTTVFLENSGKVLACGLNNGTNGGCTGHRTTNGATYIPQYVLGTSGTSSQLQNITNITCSDYHIVFLESSGKVLACGWNNGIAGNTGHRTNAGATYIPQYVLGTSGTSSQLQNITNINCSGYHTIYFENTGKVLACGNNSNNGTTGHRTNSGFTYIPQYVLGTSGAGSQLQNITNIITESINGNATYFLESSGNVLTCGLNNGTNGWTGNRTTNGVTYIPQYAIINNNSVISNININKSFVNLSLLYLNITNVVCSLWHTVFLESSGKVLTCGINGGYYGWTGHITTAGAAYYPQYVLGTPGVGSQLQNITNIFCSKNHTVFLESSGKVLACGKNNGIVGWTGHRVDIGETYIPQYVLGTSGAGSQLQNITKISCNEFNTTFLESSGKVLACGYNNGSAGWTGHRTTIGETYIPRYVLGTSGAGSQLQNITNINGNNENLTVFLESSGKVLACGKNDGFSGWTGHRTNAGATYVPQYVLGTSGTSSLLQSITNITCSTYITVFLENSGKVLACGYNNGAYTTGFTGHRTNTGTTYIPQYVLGTSGAGSQLQNITNVVCSDYNTIYLENSGKVLSCGLNDSIYIGITGNKTNYGPTYYPQYVLGTSGTSSQLQNITNIYCQSELILFLENTGKVLACGYNNGAGFTGNKTTASLTFYPQYVLGTSGTSSLLQNITNITCSAYHTVFIENQYNSRILSVGYNNGTYGGWTGHITTSGLTYIPQYAIQPQTPNNVTSNIVSTISINSITEGPDCYYAIVGSSCNVIANINNNYGKLGIQNVNSSNLNINSYIYPNDFYNNYVVNFTGSGLLSGVYEIACGMYHTVFLLYNQKAYSCGNNGFGQLGVGSLYTLTSVGKPVPMKPTVDGTNILTVACGLYHTMLLDTFGNTWGCGLNTNGQLGIGNNNNYETPTIVSPGILSGITDVQCGEYFSVFQKGSTAVYASGLNSSGQLSVGDNIDKNVPTQVVGVNNVGYLTNVKNIYCGRNETLYTLTTDTNIYLSGSYNNFLTNYPVLAGVFSNIKAIYCNKFSDDVYVKRF